MIQRIWKGMWLEGVVQRSTDLRAGEGSNEAPSFKDLASGCLGEG